MTLDLALNLVWLMLAAVALLATRYVQARAAHSRLSPFRFVSVVVVLAALFPYISALDDTLQLAHIGGGFTRARGIDAKAPVANHSGDPVWLFESLNHAEAGSRSDIAPRLSLTAFSAPVLQQRMSRPNVPSKGRDPPAA